MCSTRQRAITLLAMQAFLEREIGRLRGEGANPGELRTRLDELAIVNDELKAAMADPRITAPVAGWG